MRSVGFETIAVVEDDPVARALSRRWLEEAGHRVVEYVLGRAIIESTEDLSVVCLDLGLGDMSGIDVIYHLATRRPNVPIVVVTAESLVETAVTAMRSGAYDYIVKPIDRHRLVSSVARALEKRILAMSVAQLRTELEERAPIRSIVGNSAPMRQLADQMDRVRESDVAVAIYGESGTGKELVARAIHANGRRSEGPFVAVNCAAIPESLHESELFGHEKGAFTGAIGMHRGRFEQADKGTLFLDEISEMSHSTQASLLRTLQERRVRRIGGRDEVPVDVRIMCATNRDLSKAVKEGRFREDLYYRLVVYPLNIPALRERVDDIPLLVAHFLEKHRGDVGRDVRRVSSEALEALARYPWPGNVRELENAIHRAMLACDGDELGLSHLPPDVQAAMLPRLPAQPTANRPPSTNDLVLPIAELEKRAIDKALRATNGSVEKAAKLLGMGRATLYRRLSGLTNG
jgi:DNA-binding NtrC family response regulator